MKISQIIIIILLPLLFWGDNAGAEECENGVRRCSSLQANFSAYNRCIDETCTQGKGSFNCQAGQNACGDMVGKYKLCLDMACGELESCSHGVRECESLAKDYWSCVAQKCLGAVEQFIYRGAKEGDYRPSNFMPKEFYLVSQDLDKRMRCAGGRKLKCKNRNIASCYCVGGGLPILRMQ